MVLPHRDSLVVSETRYWLELTEYQMLALAGGTVPVGVQAMADRDLNYRREDERRAARPVKGKKDLSRVD